MRDKQKAIMLVIVLFLLGLGLGATSEHMWDAFVFASHAHHSVINDLKDQLQMTPDQEKQFDAIIKQQHAKWHELNVQEQAEWTPSGTICASKATIVFAPS